MVGGILHPDRVVRRRVAGHHLDRQQLDHHDQQRPHLGTLVDPGMEIGALERRGLVLSTLVIRALVLSTLVIRALVLSTLVRQQLVLSILVAAADQSVYQR